MTRTIQQAADFCAREFLGCELRDYGTHKPWVVVDEDGQARKPTWWNVPAPTPGFFFALHAECEARGWSIRTWTGDSAHEVLIVTGNALVAANHIKVEGCHSLADGLIRAVEQWLDAREGEA